MESRQPPVDQGVCTVVTRITVGHETALRAVLETIAATLPPNPPGAGGGAIPFEQLATVHFARWVTLPQALDADGDTIPSELVMATAYDGPLDRHLAELVTVARAGLDAIYAHCDGYPDGAARTNAAVTTYLKRHASAPAAFFVSTRWRTLGQVRAESTLRTALEAALDASGSGEPTDGMGPVLHRRLREVVERTDELRWALDPPPAPTLAWWVRHYALLTAIVVGLIVLLPVLLPIALVGLVLLRRAERQDAIDEAAVGGGTGFADVGDEIRHLKSLTRFEDFLVQNQMTLVSNVKPGHLRRAVLKAVVLYARFRTAYVDTKGTLVGIPSIHFAHWTIIDGGRRLLFVSNYDGTWESYLGDFIDRAAGGLTAVWSNTRGFPRTRFLALDGARDEQRFKAWVRAQQIPTDVWYAAYPSLSVQNVNDATAIRSGLSSRLGGSALATWLQRL
jgi:hypothetical protein